VPGWWEELLNALQAYLPLLVAYLLLVVISVLVERLLTRRIRKAVRELQLPPDVGNALVLAVRISVLVAATIVALGLGGIPSSWLVGLSALGGTAIGFASTRSMSNLISGIYLLISRPFGIGDYVRIGNLEGEVVEITVNYTKLRSPDGSTILISNYKVMDSSLVNFTYETEEGEKLIRYGFTMGFDHSIPSQELEQALRRVLKDWARRLPREPELALSKCDRGGKEYSFTFYVREARELLEVKHGLMSSILRAWEELRSGDPGLA